MPSNNCKHSHKEHHHHKKNHKKVKITISVTNICTNGPIVVPDILPSPLTLPIKAVYIGYKNITAATIADTIKTAADYGYNLIVLAFWIDPDIGVDPYSAMDFWSKLSNTDKQSTLDYIHAKNAKLIASLGGSSYTKYPANGGSVYGTAGAQFAKNNLLDGVDFDMENFTNTFGTPSGLDKSQTIQWLTDATNAARAILGADAIISNAPQSPYFNVEFANGYFDFYMQPVTPPIDFFLCQFYNQGNTYNTYETQMINCDNFHPNTAVAQLISRGIPTTKIVVGRLMIASDGDPSGYVGPDVIGQWVKQAATDPNVYYWNTGISTWQWNGNDISKNWIDTIYPASS